jgi:hypothetical protein
MIDSTDEKGDLPARSKAQRTRDPQRTQAPPQEQQPAASKPAPPAQEQGLWKPMPDDILNCIIKSATDGTSTGAQKKPYLRCVLNGYYKTFNFATAWDTGLFDALKSGVGKEVQLKMKPLKDGDKFLNIQDVLFVDGVEFVGGKPTVDMETGEILEPEGDAQ